MFGKIASFFLPVIPKKLVQGIAFNYVAGNSVEDALRKVAGLNGNGFAATVDILGEGVNDQEAAVSVSRRYISLLNEIRDRGLQSSVSIKPTHLGLNLSYETCRDFYASIAELAGGFSTRVG
ncbi:MAG: hypothetical protein FJ088_06830, partial [Deltaproteobacteria bacterium]|nr:hypothetical protein [Deltaproteobacteria bacterium]